MPTFRGRLAPLLICAAMVVLFAHLTGCGKKAEEAEVAVETLPMAPVRQPGQFTPTPAPIEKEASEPTEEAPTEEPAEPEVEEPEPEPEPEPEKPKPEPAQPEKPTDPGGAESGAEISAHPAAPPEPRVPEGVGDPKPEPAKPEPIPEPKGTVVIGTVSIASNVPDPDTVPYKDCVTFVKYKVESVESGEYEGSEVLAVLWGMKERKLQPAAGFSSGQKHRLTIEPFSNHPKLARLQTADDTNDYSLTPQWVTSFSSE